MKIQVNQASDALLDLLVAKCLGYEIIKMHAFDGNKKVMGWIGRSYSPSANWGQGGAIIDQEDINVGSYRIGCRAELYLSNRTEPIYGYGPTRLIAAMRCFVLSKLGEVVEVSEIDSMDLDQFYCYEGGVPDPEQDGDDGTECHDTEDRNPNRNGIPA